MSDQSVVISGEAAGVPYVALPPRDAATPASLVIGWHLNDPPRSAAAMAAALPLAGVAAWRVYLDLPMHGARQLPGGLEEFMRLGYQDAVLKAFEPQITQAVEEFPAVLAALWTDTSRAVAGQFDLVARADQIAVQDRQPALLLITGADDDPAFALQAQRLHAALGQRYRDPKRVAMTTIPGMGHAFAAEPGIEPAPQTAEAAVVDAAITEWFARHFN